MQSKTAIRTIFTSLIKSICTGRIVTKTGKIGTNRKLYQVVPNKKSFVFVILKKAAFIGLQ